MVRFGIYCGNFTVQNIQAVRDLIGLLKKEGFPLLLNRKLNEELSTQIDTYSSSDDLAGRIDVMVTVGGDGTILNAIQFVAGGKIPVLGVNTGRLGFLTSITPAEFPDALREIKEENYKTEERALLEIHTDPAIDDFNNLALNEISVLKKDSSSMITIHANMDGEFLNTYWADGLIISTATGSTAYSLSCGGPIVLPGSGNFIITPIAPHNLNVRPVVIPDNSIITLSFEARSGDLLVALDSTSVVIPEKTKVEIRKANKGIHLLRLKHYSYLETLRSKLNWGLDKRN